VTHIQSTSLAYPLQILVTLRRPNTGASQNWMVTDDETLTPQEFAEALVRLAMHKGKKKLASPSAKLRSFIEKDILVNATRTGRDFFALVASSPVQMVYQRHKEILSRIFAHYVVVDKADYAHQTSINLIEFSELVKELKMMKVKKLFV
jgi:hypothetical protein